MTATHEFVLAAVGDGAQSASSLGRHLNVSRQAAAKSIAALEELGYLARDSDPEDARRKTLIVTPRGHEMMTIGARTFDELRTRLSDQVGAARLETFESVLKSISAPPQTAEHAPAQRAP